MMRIKNFLIYCIVCNIVFASFKIPNILIDFQDNNIELAVYDKNKNRRYIDVEAEKIYLVRAIHDMEEGKTVEISMPENQFLIVQNDFNTNFSKKIYEEIIKLQDYKILSGVNFKENSKFKMGLINKNYQNNEHSYTVNNVIIDLENYKYILNIENKTGKILYFSFKKDNLYDKENKKEMMENYIKYLNLHIIDDWQYEENEVDKTCTMKSKKADIKITLSETEENYMLSIHIIGKFKIIDTN